MASNAVHFKNMLLIVLALSGSALLTGCVSHDYDSPHIDGVVTHQGQALPGVTVSLASANEIVQTTATDDSGHFALNPEGEWNVFIPIGPQDRMIHWSVMIDQGTSKIIGYEGGRFGGVFSGYSHGDHVRLVCDVSQAGISGYVCKKSNEGEK